MISIICLDCKNNNLPYNDLEEYWKYQEENNTEIWKKHLRRKNLNKFNI